jgi:mono/diheme cytochrome c family protein
MPQSPPLIRPVAALAAAAAILVMGGCAFSTESSDTERGRILFTDRCGSCHVLKEAQTSGVQGPDLDQAFAAARASGMDSDTIEGIVKAQVENPRPAVPGAPEVSMPADLVEGQDLEDVAAYVASVAGVPGIKPPPFTPETFFASTCGGCHTLEQAQTTGTLGPDLDEVLPGQSPAAITASIIDPGAKLTPGFPNIMPADVAAALSPQQLQALVDYLITVTGGQAAAAGGAGGGGGASAGGGVGGKAKRKG